MAIMSIKPLPAPVSSRTVRTENRLSVGSVFDTVLLLVVKARRQLEAARRAVSAAAAVGNALNRWLLHRLEVHLGDPGICSAFSFFTCVAIQRGSAFSA